MANTIDIRGDEVVLAEVASRTIAEFNDDQLSYIGEDAFGYCSVLTSISLPNVVTLDTNAFEYCRSLSSVNLPNVELVSSTCFRNCSFLTNINLPNAIRISTQTFMSCSSLTDVSLPKVRTLSTDAFWCCTALKSVSLPEATSIHARVFGSCYSLSAVYLLSKYVCTAGSSNIFISTPMTASSYLGYFGSIYVPSSLVDAYKSATNWTYWADRITAYTGE